GMSISLEGKTYVIMGVANKRSIAWGIARSLDQSGARLIVTYAGERFEKSVRDLVATLDGNHELILPCDVTNDESVEDCFSTIKDQVGAIDGLAHCIAFAKTEELAGNFSDTSRDGFLLAQNISSYSLTI